MVRWIPAALLAASPYGAFAAGRFVAVDQTRPGTDGKPVRELVLYDTMRQRCAGDGVCATLARLESPRFRLAGRHPWLDSSRLLLIEGGELVVLDLATRVARRTGVAANHVTVSVGSTVFVSTDGQTTIYDAAELTMPGTDVGRPPTFQVGGGEVAVVSTGAPGMSQELQFAVLIEDTNRDEYVAPLGSDDPPVRLLSGDARETFGLDAGALLETFVITSISSDKVVGQLVRPGQGDTPPEVFADWEITPDNGPEGRRFSVEIQPRGGL